MATRTSTEKAEVQRFESRADTVADDSGHTTDSEDNGVPPGYWWSFQFLGSAVAIVLLANNLFMGYAMAANVLNIINADIGPDPQIYLVSLVNTLIKGVLLLIVGSLSDIVGRRYFIMAGQAIGLVGSFICATANTMNVLIGANTLIGIAGAIQVLFPLLVAEIVPNKHRGAAQSAIIAMVFPTLGLGPAFARMMVEYTALRWRTLYWTNGALCGASLILFAVCYFPPNFQQLNAGKISKWDQFKRIDFVGLVLYSGGLIGVLLALSWGGKQYAWNSAPVIACLVIGIVLLIAFGFYEALMPLSTPLLPVQLFKVRNFWIFVVIGSIGQMAYYALNVLWPLHITALYTTDNMTVGWMSCTTGAALVAGEAIFGPFCKKGWHIHWQCVISATLFTLFGGLMAMSNEFRQSMAIALTIIIGMFVGWIELVCIVMASLVVPPENIGSGQAFFASSRAIAGTIATSIYLAIYTNRSGELIPKGVSAAAVNAGFPESGVPGLLSAVSKGTAAALNAVPNLTPQIRAAIAAATKSAYANSFSTVYLTSIAFGVGAIACSFFITRDYDHHFTNFVNKTVSRQPASKDPIKSKEVVV